MHSGNFLRSLGGASGEGLTQASTDPVALVRAFTAAAKKLDAPVVGEATMATTSGSFTGLQEPIDQSTPPPASVAPALTDETVFARFRDTLKQLEEVAKSNPVLGPRISARLKKAESELWPEEAAASNRVVTVDCPNPSHCNCPLWDLRIPEQQIRSCRLSTLSGLMRTDR